VNVVINIILLNVMLPIL